MEDGKTPVFSHLPFAISHQAALFSGLLALDGAALSDREGVLRCDRDLPCETQVVPGDRRLLLARTGLFLLTPHEPVARRSHGALEQGAGDCRGKRHPDHVSHSYAGRYGLRLGRDSGSEVPEQDDRKKSNGCCDESHVHLHLLRI